MDSYGRCPTRSNAERRAANTVGIGAAVRGGRLSDAIT